MTKILTHNFGFSFPMPLIIIGYVAILGGFVTLFENPIVGLLMLFVGGFIALSTHGTQINTITKQYRGYGSYYGIKTGEWKPLEDFPFLSVLSGRSGQTVYDMTNQSTTSITNYVNVCLLSPDHRKRVVIQKFESAEPATEYAKTLSTILEVPIVRFNPPISEKTLKRRRR